MPVCPICKQSKWFLTKHSLIGGHQPPFIRICRKCHDKEHGITHYKTKYNKKVQRGTRNGKKKK